MERLDLGTEFCQLNTKQSTNNGKKPPQNNNSCQVAELAGYQNYLLVVGKFWVQIPLDSLN